MDIFTIVAWVTIIALMAGGVAGIIKITIQVQRYLEAQRQERVQAQESLTKLTSDVEELQELAKLLVQIQKDVVRATTAAVARDAETTGTLNSLTSLTDRMIGVQEQLQRGYETLAERTTTGWWPQPKP